MEGQRGLEESEGWRKTGEHHGSGGEWSIGIT